MVKVIVEVEGEDDYIYPAMILIARKYGWTQNVIDTNGQEISNPIEPKEYVRKAIGQFLRETALNQAGEDARAAEEQARNQVNQVLDTLNLTLNVV